jgi:osmotically-inducible protein OsmY
MKEFIMNTNAFRSTGGRSLTVVSSLALLLALGACNKQGEDRTVGQQVDSAINKTEQAAKESSQEARQAMASAESSVKESARDATAAAKNGAAVMTEKLDDASITASVSAGLAKDPELSAIKIDVDTKNGVVNLQGPAPSTDARERATSIAKNVKGVASVNNQLVVRAG